MPINWVDGSAGGTPLSAANLAKLAVTADLGTPGTPTGDAARAAFAASVPELFETFTGKSNGALTVADSGQTWLKSSNGATGSSLSIIGGKLTNTASSSGVAAGYATAVLGGNVRRVGARFTLGAASGGGDASATIGVWKTPISSDPISTVPDSPFHLAITATLWILGVWNGNAMTTIAQANFATPLTADGATVYRSDNVIDGSTAYLLLPDGSTAVVTDSRISTNNGPNAFFEVYQNNAATDGKGAFVDVWADSGRPDRRSPVSAVEDLIRLVATTRATPPPVATRYSPATQSTITLGTGFTGALDSAHLVATVTFPPSGKIGWRFSGYFFFGATTALYLGLAEGSTNFDTVKVAEAGSAVTGLHTVEGLVTGTPGTTHNYALSGWADAASTVQLLSYGSNGWVSVLTITPLAA